MQGHRSSNHSSPPPRPFLSWQLAGLSPVRRTAANLGNWKIVMDWDLWSLRCILQTWLRRPVFGLEPLLLSEPRNYGDGSSRTSLTTQCKFPEYSTSIPVSWIYKDHFLTRQVLDSISKKASSIVHYSIWYIRTQIQIQIHIHIQSLKFNLHECTTCWRIIDIFWIFPLPSGPQNVFDLWHIDVDFFHFWTLPWQHSVQRHFDLGASTWMTLKWRWIYLCAQVHAIIIHNIYIYITCMYTCNSHNTPCNVVYVEWLKYVCQFPQGGYLGWTEPANVFLVWTGGSLSWILMDFVRGCRLCSAPTSTHTATLLASWQPRNNFFLDNLLDSLAGRMHDMSWHVNTKH